MSRHTTVPLTEPAQPDGTATLSGTASCSTFDMALFSAGFATRCGAGLLQRALSLPLLDDTERAARAAQQDRLWSAGAKRCIDEGLLADAIRRNPHIALTMAGTAPRAPEDR